MFNINSNLMCLLFFVTLGKRWNRFKWSTKTFGSEWTSSCLLHKDSVKVNKNTYYKMLQVLEVEMSWLATVTRMVLHKIFEVKKFHSFNGFPCNLDRLCGYIKYGSIMWCHQNYCEDLWFIHISLANTVMYYKLNFIQCSYLFRLNVLCAYG